METYSEKRKYQYISFNPGDWLKDIALNSCSLQTQGAWMRLMCHMHESEMYGYLVLSGGKPLDKKGIQNLLRVDDKTYDEIWFELTDRGVIKKDNQTGAYYSKRMVNDYKKFSKTPEANDQIYKITENIIKHLNKKCNTQYNPSDKEFIKLINDKIVAGYKEIDFKKVIDVKSEEWLGDSKMGGYLRPSTLFGNKFPEYLSQYDSLQSETDDKKSTKATEINEQINKITENVIKYLNKKCNTEFNYNDKEFIKLINEKINSGYKEIDFKKVIEIKSEEWLGDSKMSVFLRPSTLFGNKFPEYLSQYNTLQSSKEKTAQKPKNPYNNMMK